MLPPGRSGAPRGPQGPESPEAIRAFAGDEIAVSIVEPEAQAMLTSFDLTATHRSVVIDARG